MRGVNPLTITAFFTNLKDMWLERNPCVSTQIPIVSQPIQPILTPQNDIIAEGNKAFELVKRLSKDLDYSGIATDVDTIGTFIYDDLGRRFGRKTNHNRRSPFSELQVRNTNATKKVKRVIQKVPARQIVTQQIVRHCSVCENVSHTKVNCPGVKRIATQQVNRHYSACGNVSHTKVNCPGVKRTKKVNYVYQDEVEDFEASEDEEYIEEYIMEEEDEAEEEEIEEDDDNDEPRGASHNDDKSASSRNCYAVKKKKVVRSGVPIKKSTKPKEGVTK